MTRAELGERMSSKEFSEWMVFYEWKEEKRKEGEKEIEREAELERRQREAGRGFH